MSLEPLSLSVLCRNAQSEQRAAVMQLKGRPLERNDRCDPVGLVLVARPSGVALVSMLTEDGYPLTNR